MSSEIKPKLIHRLKIGKLECSLYGRPRQKPLFTEQVAAFDRLKKAVIDEFRPLLMFLRKIGF